MDSALKESGATPLCLAAQHGSMEFVQLLLARGADPNVTMKGGISAFFLACQGPSVEVAKVFLEAGADVNCRMEATGATPLIMAALKNKVDAVEMLLSKAGPQHGGVAGPSLLVHSVPVWVPPTSVWDPLR